jgi:hypothetical protein
MNAQEVHDKLEPRLLKMEYFKWFLWGQAALVGLIFTGGLWRFISLSNDVGSHETRLSAAERHHSELQAKHDKLFEAYSLLRTRVTVLVDRRPRAVPEALTIDCRIQSISREQIAFLPDDIGEPSYKYFLAANVSVRIKQKAAKLGDLKPGMKVTVTVSKGEVIQIDSESGGG